MFQKVKIVQGCHLYNWGRWGKGTKSILYRQLLLNIREGTISSFLQPTTAQCNRGLSYSKSTLLMILRNGSL